MRRLPAFAPLALVLLAACGGGRLSNVNAQLELAPAALDFGKRPVLDDLTLKVHLTNVGRAPAELKFSLSGDSAFTLVSGPKSLEGGAEGDVAVSFTATEQKAYAGKLLIDTNEVDTPHHEVPLTGVGSTVAAATIAPASLDFGRVGEGRSKVLAVTLTSTGTADLKIKSIALKQPGTNVAYGFVGSTRTPLTLAHHVEGTDDALAQVNVKFAPTAATVGTGLTGTLLVETTDPAHELVSIPLTARMNQAPIAVPGDAQEVAPGSVVQLDGSRSSDPDGDLPLTYQWTLTRFPQASAATLSDAASPKPTFTADQPGEYDLQLVVVDSAGLSSAPKQVAITAVAADKLVIELLWDHPVADLDLHFRRPGDALNGPMDCFWANPHPDWGVQGDPTDDPTDLGDKLAGFGPEYVVYDQPPAGEYVMAVDYVSANGASNTKLTATLRVWLYGAVVQELDHSMSTPGEVWTAGTVAWPSGAVTLPAGSSP